MDSPRTEFSDQAPQRASGSHPVPAPEATFLPLRRGHPEPSASHRSRLQHLPLQVSGPPQPQKAAQQQRLPPQRDFPNPALRPLKFEPTTLVDSVAPRGLPPEAPAGPAPPQPALEPLRSPPEPLPEGPAPPRNLPRAVSAIPLSFDRVYHGRPARPSKPRPAEVELPEDRSPSDLTLQLSLLRRPFPDPPQLRELGLPSEPPAPLPARPAAPGALPAFRKSPPLAERFRQSCLPAIPADP